MGTWVTTCVRRWLPLAILILALAACGGGAAKTAAPAEPPAAGSSTSGGPAADAATSTPEGPSAPSDIPIIEGANIERGSEGVLEYRVATPLSDIVEFYQTELPNMGWEPAGNPSIMPIVASMVYRKDKQNLSINMQFNEKAQSTLVRLFWQGY